jgi:hypothetical protein
MGVELTVTIPAGRSVRWPAVVERLAARGLAAQVRMIDGLPALPDEQPPDDWGELRAGTPGGMVTLRRRPDGVSLVVWGTADAGLRRDWHVLTWAVADAAGGSVRTEAGDLTAAEFGRVIGDQ